MIINWVSRPSYFLSPVVIPWLGQLGGALVVGPPETLAFLLFIQRQVNVDLER